MFNLSSKHESHQQNHKYHLTERNKGSSRKKFTPDEDQILLNLINQNGAHTWDLIAKYMPGRSGRQCRDRYKNYLMEDLENGPWTFEEDELLIKKYQELGSRWSLIAKYFKGRSTNNLKNRWYTYHKKKDTNLNRVTPIIGMHDVAETNNFTSLPIQTESHKSAFSFRVTNSPFSKVKFARNETTFSEQSLPNLDKHGMHDSNMNQMSRYENGDSEFHGRFCHNDNMKKQLDNYQIVNSNNIGTGIIMNLKFENPSQTMIMPVKNIQTLRSTGNNVSLTESNIYLNPNCENILPISTESLNCAPSKKYEGENRNQKYSIGNLMN